MGKKKYRQKVLLTLVIIGVLAFSMTFSSFATQSSCYSESAWAYGGQNSIPFTDLGFGNWGWTNGPYGEGTYFLDLYAGAGKNILGNGIIVGQVKVEYINGSVDVEYEVLDDFYTLNEVHLWIGETKLPMVKKGNSYVMTNAPGKFDLGKNHQFSNEIYVAMHAEVSIPHLANSYGADVNPTGNNIGGGNGYTNIISENDPRVTHSVDSQSTLLSALQQAQFGDVIYIKGDANIDMTGIFDVQIPAGVTLASNRGENGALGGRIYQTRPDPQEQDPNIVYWSTLLRGNEHVRITGLRIEGPDKTIDQLQVNEAPRRAITSLYRNLEVDNCELWGWSGTAICLYNTSGFDMKTGCYIHHNNIHHCQMSGLGYGVMVGDYAVALVEANYFDYCRHAIAGTGGEECGYEARYNICGPNFISHSAHNFDMHGVNNPSGVGKLAGRTIKIYHNTFLATEPTASFPIFIQGVPRDMAYIANNWFLYVQREPVMQSYGDENMIMVNNIIGSERTLYPSGPILYYLVP